MTSSDTLGEQFPYPTYYRPIKGESRKCRWIALIGILLCSSLSASTLDVFLANIENNTLQAEFTLTISESAAQPMNYPGSICMQGNKFLLSMFDTEAAYDGKTLYIYNVSNDELTLSHPTEGELLEANPFLFAKALVEECNVAERSNKNGSETIITLTPKDPSTGIQRFILRVRRAENTKGSIYLPLSIEIKEGKQVTTLTLKQPQYISKTVSYRLDYPDAYLNDLR